MSDEKRPKSDPPGYVDPPPTEINLLSGPPPSPPIKTAAITVTIAGAFWIIKIIYDIFFCGCV